MDKKYTIDDLLEILKILRSENGCPWDRAQTHDSIKKSMIEETYEAIDALDSGDDAAFANELGDVLLQVAFHAALAKERGAFDFDDILREICTKLITRHTHVFGKDKAATAEDALGTWEKNKKKEKGLKTDTELLKDVPHGLPALMRAQKVQKKAASCGFDFENIREALKKVSEEAGELAEAREKLSEKEISEEYGDLLFAMVNMARFLHVDAEVALTDCTNKFIRRFGQVESLAEADGQKIEDMSADELDKLWNKVKNNEKKNKNQINY